MAVVIAGVITGGILVTVGGYALHRLLNARRRELESAQQGSVEPTLEDKREQQLQEIKKQSGK